METLQERKIDGRKIRPVSTGILTTADRYTDDDFTDGGVLELNRMKGKVKLKQKVLSVGDLVKYCKAGDIVEISPVHYLSPEVQKQVMATKDVEKVKKVYYNYDFPMIEAFGQDCLFIDQSDIRFIYME